MFCLELWYSVESIVLDAAIQLSAYREQHISKQNYEITELHEIHNSRLNLQRWPLKLVIFFYKVYI